MSVIITHNFGFFSCCSVRLNMIVDYINKHKNLNFTVDSSKQFEWYKKNVKTDITFDYFKHYDDIKIDIDKEHIDFVHEYQYIDYNNLNYRTIVPVVKKYFTPSENIEEIVKNIEQKYNINYDNTCVLFYRGNDKQTETNLSSYAEYIPHINNIIAKNPEIKFLIQSDETEFIQEMIQLLQEKSFYFKDETRHIKKSSTTVDIVFKDQNSIFSKYYLAITIIMSKCKYIICGSGNCSIWIMLFRGNCNNVYQYLNDKMLIHKTISRKFYWNRPKL
jgi:hypothetical protein